MGTVRLTMAQALLKFLDQQYVVRDGKEYKFVHGVMGIFGHGNVNGIGEALEQGVSGLRYIQSHNEQGMVHAAIAFAKQKDRLGIFACTSSIGPGALNMVTAAATATINRIPVLLLPGDIFACRQPDPVLQQLEVPSDYTVSVNDAFKPVSRYWDRIDRPEQLMTAAMNAMRVLTDPADTGAVTLCLPQDVQTQAYDYPESFFRKRVHYLDRRPAAPAELERAVELIRRKRRPLIICGGGVHYSQASEALAQFAERFVIPVAETQAGKSALPWDHPLNMGGVGVTGSLAANRLAREADLVVAVGTRLTDFTTASKTAFRPDAAFLSINVNRMDAMKMESLCVLADAREALSALGDALAEAGYRSGYRMEELRELKAEWDAEVDRLCAVESEEGLTQTRVLGEINRMLGPEDVIVAASGGLPGDLHRLWRCGSRKSYHMEYGFSCMGYEACGAFGVKLAEPHREVYAILGDGSYLMLHSELITSLQEGVKVNALLLDNSGYQCIHQLQKGHGSRGFGNEFRRRAPETGQLTGEYLHFDFAAHAESLGMKGYTARTVSELREALRRAKEEDRSTLIDIKVVPGTGTGNYESWWRVDVAETSTSESVREAHREMQKRLQQAKAW